MLVAGLGPDKNLQVSCIIEQFFGIVRPQSSIGLSDAALRSAPVSSTTMHKRRIERVCSCGWSFQAKVFRGLLDCQCGNFRVYPGSTQRTIAAPANFKPFVAVGKMESSHKSKRRHSSTCRKQEESTQPGQAAEQRCGATSSSNDSTNNAINLMRSSLFSGEGGAMDWARFNWSRFLTLSGHARRARALVQSLLQSLRAIQRIDLIIIGC